MFNQVPSRSRYLSVFVAYALLLAQAAPISTATPLITQPPAQNLFGAWRTTAPPLPSGPVTAQLTDNIINTMKVDKGSTINYTAVITNTTAGPLSGVEFQDTPDSNTTLVAGSIHASPIATNDSYSTVGNTLLEVGVTPSGAPSVTSSTKLFANDAIATDSIQLKTFQSSSAHGGTVSVNADGSFTYLPPVGFTGSDTFTYTINNSADNTLTDTATVTITVSNMVWYVNNAVSNGDGRSNSPFNSLTPLNGASGNGDSDSAGDIIYLFTGSGNYTTGLVLENNEQLIGNGTALVVGGNTLRAAGTRPTMATNPITLASGNTLSGFNMSNNGASAAISGASVGTLTISNMQINTTGGALDLTGVSTPSVNVVLDSVNSSGGTNNVKLTGLGGTVTLGSGALSGASGDSLLVSNGTVAISYSGTIASGNAHSVNVSGMTGGSVSISGKVTDTDTGITLTSNTGATINFTGGISASTGANTAFNATGGGTVNATQDNNTIVNTLATTTGTALNVTSTNIGASGLTFRSINAGTGASGPSSGIILNTTGSTGGLTITGLGNTTMGGDFSGGTIQHTTARGIQLTSTAKVNLNNIKVDTTANAGIGGSGVTDFTLTYSTVSNNGSAHTSVDSNIDFGTATGGAPTDNNVQGVVTITNNVLNNAWEHGIDIQNYSGTITNATISNNSLTSSSVAANSHGSGIRLLGFGSASGTSNITKATISNNTINYFPGGAGITSQYGNSGGTGGTWGDPNSATNLITISGNTITGFSAAVPVNTNAILATLTGNGQANWKIDNNTASLVAGSYIGVTIRGVAPVAKADITNNHLTGMTFSAAQTIAYGVDFLSASTDHPTLKGTISGNTITSQDGQGIQALATSGSSGILNVSILNNTISAPNCGGCNRFGMTVDAGLSTTVTGTPTVCAKISGNTSAGSGVDTGIGFRERTGCTLNIDSLPGAPTDPTSYITSLNPNGGGVTNITNSTAGSCAAPLMFAKGGIGVDAFKVFGFDQFSNGGEFAPFDFAVKSFSPPSAVTTSLTQEQLDSVVVAAIERWSATGLTPQQLATLRSIKFEVADLSDSYLGEAEGNRIFVDRDASDQGWYVGADAESDLLFGNVVSSTRHYTDAASLPAGHLDLLTALEHEMGHRLGLDDTYAASDRDNLMYGYLTAGERRLPAQGQAAGAKANAASRPHFLYISGEHAPRRATDGQTSAPSREKASAKRANRGAALPTVAILIPPTSPPVDVTIGALPQGKAVTIKFQVTINTTLNPNNAASVQTQGTVIVSGFSNTVTDDPDTATQNDATVTLIAHNDLAVTSVTDGVTSTSPGNTLTYVISYSNPGRDAAGVTLTETVPAGTTFNSGASSSGWTCSPNNNAGSTCTNIIGSLSSSATGTKNFAVTVNSPAAAGLNQIQNTASIASTDTTYNNYEADIDTSNNSKSDTDTLNAQPAFGTFTLDDGTTTTIPGSTLTYTVSYANTGNQGATGVVLTETVPVGTTFVATGSDSWTNCSDGAAAGTQCTISVGNLAGGGNGTGAATFKVKVDSTVAAGLNNIVNNASITDDGQNSASPVTASAQDRDMLNAAPDLSITKSPDVTNASPGQTITYTINYSNGGNQGATGVTVTETVPANTTFVASGSSTWTGCADGAAANTVCTNTVGALAAGSNGTLTFKVKVNNSIPGGTTQITNVATIDDDHANGTDPNTSNNSTGNVNTLLCQSTATVTNTNDSGAGSLRQAITDVCPSGTINFQIPANDANHQNNTYTITLTSGELAIAKNLTINGPNTGANTDAIVVSGNNASRIFNVGQNLTVNISNLTAKNGNASTSGGAIVNNDGSTLTLTNVVVSNSTTTGGGGGVASVCSSPANPNLILIGSTINGNTANDLIGGGGIYFECSGTLYVDNSTIDSNHSTSTGIGAYGGGGISINAGSKLSVSNSTISNNTASNNAGGIYAANSTADQIGLINTTVSGNSANLNGGGLYGRFTLVNTTVTNNRADADDDNNGTGGGIYTNTLASSLLNSIVAGNFHGAGSTADDIDTTGGGSATGSFNLIGTGGTGGLTNGVNNNQVGVADAKLGSLANNGGATKTHALLAGSTAIDAGTDLTTLSGNGGSITNTATTINVADATAIPDKVNFVIQIDSEQMIVTAKTSNTLTVTRYANGTTAVSHNDGAAVNPAFDQRGTPFKRKLKGSASGSVAVDIGAFEVQPPTAVDDSYSTNEDTPLHVNAPGVLSNDTGTGTKTVTQVNSTNIGSPISTTHGSVTMSSDGSFTYTPAGDYNGSDSFTYTVTDSGGGSAKATVTITINAINDAPVAVNDSYSTNEDTPLSVNAANGVVANDTDVDTPHSSLTASIVSNPSHASSFTLNSDGSFSYTPNTNFNGQDTFTYKVNDGSADSNTATVTITINSVNDPPTTSNNSVTTLEDTAYTFQAADFPFSDTSDNPNANTLLNVIITSLPSAGTLKYNGTAISSVPTSVSATDITAGKLTFSPAADANGSPYTTFSFKVQDNGGTANGGQDTSTAATMTINITAVNDAPSFTKGADQTVNEDAGAQTVNGWATSIKAGPSDENGQTLNFIVTNDNNGLFTGGGQPAVSSNGTLTYTPAADANGSATVTVLLQDNGGTTNGGQDTSATQTFTITVNSVNDVPSFTKGADQTVFANSGAQTVNGWATNISAGPANENVQTVNFIVTNNNNSLFSTQPAVSPTGVLTYMPATNQSGSALVSVQIHDNGGTANGGVDTSAIQTFTINVNKSNTQTTLSSSPNPSFTGQTVTFMATVTSQTTVTGPTGTVDFIDTSSGNASVCSGVTLSGDTAQCQTSTLSAANSPHVIQAKYNGDGAFNASNSNTVSQVVKPVLNLTVNDTGDTHDADLTDDICADSNGKCTLRAAIEQTNFATSDDTIGFDTAAGHAFDPASGPHTITLSSSLPDITGNLVINGPGPKASNLVISGNNTFRLMSAAGAGVNLTINKLSFTGGQAGGGQNAAALEFKNAGTLTINDSEFYGNAINASLATLYANASTSIALNRSTFRNNGTNNNSGRAIMVESGIALTVLNNTISNNNGVGIYNRTTSLVVTNSTIANNSTGIFNDSSLNPSAATLGNTLLSNNNNNNILKFGVQTNTFTSNGHNLIDDNTSSQLAAPGTGDLLGTSVQARLAPLADNGGATQTRALLPGSAALDAGDNTLATNAGLTTDQRGTGFNRIVDSSDADSTATVDIGAFEAQPSIDAIPDKTTNEDTALPSFSFGVADGGVSNFAVTATSNNTTLVPNDNAHLSLSGAGSTRSLSITPAANQFGTALISVKVSGTIGSTPVSMTSSFTLTVNSVNDAPSFTAGGNQTVNEDAGAQSVQWATNISAGSPNESSQQLNFIVSNNNNRLFTAGGQPAISPTGVLTYTPAPDANGVATVTVALHDDGGTANGGVDTSPQVQFTITVNAVNDPPVNIVPGSQATPRNTDLVFSAANANQIATSDVDAGNNPVQVTLTATNGRLTLAGTAGLNFSVGNGTANTTMTFTGTITNINTALNGMIFSPTPGFDGAASVQITTNDQGFTGLGGPQSDTDTVNITVNKGGVLAFSSSTYSVSEGGGSITITVNRIGGSSGTTKVDFATSNGTATAGADYTATSGTLTFGNGETTKTFSVPILEDQLNEANETINLSLTNVQGSGDIGSPSAAVITISDNDPQPSLSINDVSKSEGNSGTTDFTFTVSLSAVSGQNVSVNYATADGTATVANNDYQATSGTLTFSPGDTQKTITVKVVGDTITEPDETFFVNLSNAANAAISKNQGTGTILNDDAPVVQLSSSTYTVAENGLHATITVNRLGDLSKPATVDYATSDPSGLLPCSQVTGNASQRCDYAISVGTLRFAANESSKTIFIPIVNDVYVEGPELFTLTLSNPTGLTLGTITSATVTITDDDNGGAINPITDDAFFIRQLYIDFLDREPDPPGLQGWLDILHNTSGQCKLPTDCDRIAVALGFVRSPEFQDRGYFIFRFYSTALGRNPNYFEFMADMARVSGFLNSSELEANKTAFVDQFMGRQEFRNMYDSTLSDPAGYVDKLLKTVGIPNHPGRSGWIVGLTNGTLTRAQVLRQLVESVEVYTKFYNQALIVMQYFGFLRRDPDAAYLQWIDIFNHSDDYRILVNGFINSPEYPTRFGP